MKDLLRFWPFFLVIGALGLVVAQALRTPADHQPRRMSEAEVRAIVRDELSKRP